MGYPRTTQDWRSRWVGTSFKEKSLRQLRLQPDPRYSKKMLDQLQAHFTYLGSRFGRAAGTKGSAGGDEDFVGEYQMLLEQEMFDFVLYEIPWITN